MSRLLISEPPLLVLPLLAKTIGLNEAILLQQLHYWLKRSKHEAGGERWVYNTYADWLEQLPFWSEKTLRRIVKNLEDSQLLISTYEFNFSINKTKWYRIDYTKLNALIGTPSKTELIIDDYPLMFQPSLAVSYGLNEAIFLQQLHYWLKYGNPKQQDANVWVVSSYKNWLKQFSFWSEDTLYRTIKKLSEMNLVIATGKYNSSAMDKTKWLTIRYDMFPAATIPQVDQTIPQVDQTIPQVDQTIPQVDRTIPQVDRTIPQVDRTIPQVDRTIPQVDRTIPQSDRITPQIDRIRHRNLTSPHYYIDYKTETITKTERKTVTEEFSTASLEISANAVKTHNIEEFIEDESCSAIHGNQESRITSLMQVKERGKPDAFETCEMSLKDEIRAQFEKIFAYFIALIDNSAHKRLSKFFETEIEKGLKKHGNSFADVLFDSIKKSDFLLGHKSFEIKLSWIINNADKIISGMYDTDGMSLYEQAQDCCEKEKVCHVIKNDMSQPKKICRYCQKYVSRANQPKEKEKTVHELAEDCRKQGFCTVKKLKMKTHFPFCEYCELKNTIKIESDKENLIKQAMDCFEKCKGMCSHKVMQTPAMDFCAYCPDPSGPYPSKLKRSKDVNNNEGEVTKEISIDYKDSDAAWKAAYQFVKSQKERNRIRKIMNLFQPFTTYSITDLENDAIIIAYQVLIDLALKKENGHSSSVISLSDIESHYTIKLKNHMTHHYVTIPALKNVIKTDNKSACHFDDIFEISEIADIEKLSIEDIILKKSETKSDSNEILSHSEEAMKILKRILPVRQEQILTYRLGEIHGNITYEECGKLLNCSDKNVMILEKKAIETIKKFISEAGITKSTSLDELQKKVREHQIKHFKPVKFDGYFELGNLFFNAS